MKFLKFVLPMCLSMSFVSSFAFGDNAVNQKKSADDLYEASIDSTKRLADVKAELSRMDFDINKAEKALANVQDNIKMDRQNFSMSNLEKSNELKAINRNLSRLENQQSNIETKVSKIFNRIEELAISAKNQRKPQEELNDETTESKEYNIQSPKTSEREAGQNENQKSASETLSASSTAKQQSYEKSNSQTPIVKDEIGNDNIKSRIDTLSGQMKNVTKTMSQLLNDIGEIKTKINNMESDSSKNSEPAGDNAENPKSSEDSSNNEETKTNDNNSSTSEEETGETKTEKDNSSTSEEESSETKAEEDNASATEEENSETKAEEDNGSATRDESSETKAEEDNGSATRDESSETKTEEDKGSDSEEESSETKAEEDNGSAAGDEDSETKAEEDNGSAAGDEDSEAKAEEGSPAVDEANKVLEEANKLTAE